MFEIVGCNLFKKYRKRSDKKNRTWRIVISYFFINAGIPLFVVLSVATYVESHRRASTLLQNIKLHVFCILL